MSVEEEFVVTSDDYLVFDLSLVVQVVAEAGDLSQVPLVGEVSRVDQNVCSGEFGHVPVLLMSVRDEHQVQPVLFHRLFRSLLSHKGLEFGILGQIGAEGTRHVASIVGTLIMFHVVEPVVWLHLSVDYG